MDSASRQRKYRLKKAANAEVWDFQGCQVDSVRGLMLSYEIQVCETQIEELRMLLDRLVALKKKEGARASFFGGMERSRSESEVE